MKQVTPPVPDEMGIFSDTPLEQRYELLKNNAYSIQREEVKRDFDPIEMEHKRLEFVDNSVSILNAELEIKRLTTPLKNLVKETTKRNKQLVKDLKEKCDTALEEVFYFDDQANNLMRAYDSAGNFLYSRKLKPSEKQTTVHSINKQKTA